ncbi:MAG: tetratricopeptide repeat protein [Bacteroidales bacterium]|nr:tetratricopeptide repeat protein [Bacteroidales bacterium]
MNKQNLLIIGFIIVFAFILYGNTIQNSYSLDDDYVTFSDPTVRKGIKAIPEIFTSLYANVYGDGGKIKFGYRPIVKTTYAIESEFFGANPHISHLINILLYAFTCILVFFLLRRLFKDYHILFPLLVTTFFMAHPVHTEVVSSLKNRDELLSFMFNIITLIFFVRYADKQKIIFIFAGLLSFLLAYLSKLTALSFIAIIPLVLYFFTKTDHRKIIYILLAVIAVFLIARILPKFYLPDTSRTKLFVENPLIFENYIWTRTATGFYILLLYLKLLIYPHPLLFYYGYNMIPMTDWSNIWAISSFVIYLLIFIYAIKRIRQKHILSFGILYYLITISLYTNMVKPPAGIIGERFLLAPSLGFCVVITYFIFRVLKKQAQTPNIELKQSIWIVLISLFLLIPYTAKTIVRNKDWKDHLSLMSHDIKYLENSAKANFIYAGALKTEALASIRNNQNTTENMQKLDLSIKHFKNAVDVYPEYYEALNQLGSLYYTVYHDPITAVSYLKRSIEVRPDYKPPYYNLAYIYKSSENYKEAIFYYKKMLEIDPAHLQSIKDLEDLYNTIGDTENAYYYKEMTRKINAGNK